MAELIPDRLGIARSFNNEEARVGLSQYNGMGSVFWDIHSCD